MIEESPSTEAVDPLESMREHAVEARSEANRYQGLVETMLADKDYDNARRFKQLAQTWGSRAASYEKYVAEKESDTGLTEPTEEQPAN